MADLSLLGDIRKTLTVQDEHVWEYDSNDEDIFEEEFEVIRDDFENIIAHCFRGDVVVEMQGTPANEVYTDELNELYTKLCEFVTERASDELPDNSVIDITEYLLIVGFNTDWQRRTGIKLMYDDYTERDVFDFLMKGFDRCVLRHTINPRVLHATRYSHDVPTGSSVYLISLKSFMIKE